MAPPPRGRRARARPTRIWRIARAPRGRWVMMILAAQADRPWRAHVGLVHQGVVESVSPVRRWRRCQCATFADLLVDRGGVGLVEGALGRHRGARSSRFSVLLRGHAGEAITSPLAAMRCQPARRKASMTRRRPGHRRRNSKPPASKPSQKNNRAGAVTTPGLACRRRRLRRGRRQPRSAFVSPSSRPRRHRQAVARLRVRHRGRVPCCQTRAIARCVGPASSPQGGRPARLRPVPGGLEPRSHRLRIAVAVGVSARARSQKPSPSATTPVWPSMLLSVGWAAPRSSPPWRSPARFKPPGVQNPLPSGPTSSPGGRPLRSSCVVVEVGGAATPAKRSSTSLPPSSASLTRKSWRSQATAVSSSPDAVPA